MTVRDGGAVPVRVECGRANRDEQDREREADHETDDRQDPQRALEASPSLPSSTVRLHLVPALVRIGVEPRTAGSAPRILPRRSGSAYAWRVQRGLGTRFVP